MASTAQFQDFELSISGFQKSRCQNPGLQVQAHSQAALHRTKRRAALQPVNQGS